MKFATILAMLLPLTSFAAERFFCAGINDSDSTYYSITGCTPLAPIPLDQECLSMKFWKGHKVVKELTGVATMGDGEAGTNVGQFMIYLPQDEEQGAAVSLSYDSNFPDYGHAEITLGNNTLKLKNVNCVFSNP
jgi:hypothetical protein